MVEVGNTEEPVFSDQVVPTEMTNVQLSEVTTGMVDPLSSEGHTGMANSQRHSSSQSHASKQAGYTTPSGTSGVWSVKKKDGRHRSTSSYSSFSETTGSVDSQHSQTSTASLKQLKHDIRRVSEKLGSLLNSRLYVGQTDQFKQQLRDVSQNRQLPLERVINCPIKRYNDRTCVHLAASNGLYECLEELLKSGGNPNVTSSAADLCQTPLHMAAEKGYARCLEILIDHGADIMTRNMQQNSAQDMIRGKKTCERVLQNAMCKVIIPARSKEQQQKVVDLHSLLKDRKDPIEFNKLYDSLPPNHMDLSTRWTDWDRQTLLYRVCAIQSVGIVEHMLSKSKKKPLHNTSNEYNPLHIACKNGNTEIARRLLSHSPHLLLLQAGKEKLSPLHVACSIGGINMVELLLDAVWLLIQSEDTPFLILDYKDSLGHTPLFYACVHGHTAIVKLLIEFQAKHSDKVIFDVNSAEPAQSTPLHAAVQSGSIDTLKMLLHVKDINLNAKARPADNTQKRCIHILEKNRHGRVISVPEDVDQGGTRITPSTDTIPIQSRTPEPTSPPYGTSVPTNPFCTPPSSGRLQAPEDHSSSEVHSKDRSPGQSTLAAMPKRHSKKKPSRRHSTISKISSTDLGESSIGIVEINIGSLEVLPLGRKRITLTARPKYYSKKKPSRRHSVISNISSTDLGESSIGIFEIEYGRFEVLALGSSGNKSFNQLLMTPLAEACAYGNTEMVKLLLHHGARDDDGLACRISSFIQLPDLAQLVLAHHCTVIERQKNPTGVTDTAARLQLQWGSRKLISLDGSWFSNTSEYFPVQGEKEDVDSDTGYCSRMGLSQMQVQRTSSIAKYNGFNVRVIHLQHNHLQSIPLEMFCLPNLEEIDLSHNECMELPSGWKCAQLKELTLSHNQLNSLPTSVWALPALRKLVATDNKLETLLEEQVRSKEDMLSKSLEHIDLSNNDFITLPSFLFLLPSLKKAILQHNKLEHLPDTVWSSATIQELIINHNHLTYLPKCEPNEPHFTESAYKPPNITVQPSDKIPSAIVEIRPRLGPSLSKSDRPQTSVHGIRPVTVKQDVSFSDVGVGSYEYSSLKKLSIADNRLETFPVGLPCFAPNLIELDVSNNSFKNIDIRFIPQFIIKFTARSCKIERFGIVLTRAAYSEVLKSCLHVETFGHPCQHRRHHCLLNLTNLKLSENRLRHFQILFYLPLDTGDVEVEVEAKFVPTNIDLLYPALEALELSSNDLQGEFNPNIGHQSHLKQIQLDNNLELRKLPMEFAHLRKTRQLTEFQRNGLPKLIDPPEEYLNEQVSVNHLLTYMRSRLKKSQEYRTIKLFFIGKERRGKTTLLRRLKDIPDSVVHRTVGIDIEDWIYSPKIFFKSASKPVHFLAWDFAGQEVYHTTHQCFYSRRSLYLALFRLTDGNQGVEELMPWLRNVQLRAPGCPVIIVGTHLDKVPEQEAIRLKELALEKYKDISFYPKIVSVEIVSSVKHRRLFSTNYIHKLQRVIYDTACHLQVFSDEGTLEYKPDMSLDDPKALFQQKIPESFLNLQDAIRGKVAADKQQSVAKAIPIMDETTFKATFMNQCEDEDELNEAVYFLHMQGTLLHFEDHGLRDVYFLDPQWLAKLMASVFNPATQNESSPIQNGIGEIGQLFTHEDIPDCLKEQCIQLLEKFELVLRIGRDKVIIPSLLPDHGVYPPAQSCPSNLTNYQPPLRRFWVSNYIPDGFWPRLICRIASDQQINKVLNNETQFSLVEGCGRFNEPHECTANNLDNWIPWKTGIAHTHQDRTLVVIKLESSEDGEERLKWIQGSFRIEIHIHVPEWITLAKVHGEENYSLDYVRSLAASLIVMISQHVRALGNDWFPGMFLTPSSQHGFTTYMPCWKCCAQLEADTKWQPPRLPRGYISKHEKPIYCFTFEVPAVEQKDMECPVHGFMKLAEIAPDLVLNEVGRSDLAESTVKRYQYTHFRDETIPKASAVETPCESLILPQSLPTASSTQQLALPSLPMGDDSPIVDSPETQMHHLQDHGRLDSGQFSCPPCAYDSEMVSFIDPPEVVMFNSRGGVYRNSLHGITLFVPEGAVPDGKSIHIQVGVALYGPFVWPKHGNIVSPIVGLCTGSEGTELQKPVEIRIPHFINCSEVEDCKNLTFLKANHRNDIVTIDGKPKYSLKPFHIQQTHGERIQFEPGLSFGILQTKHFCYLCIAEKYTRKCTEQANFCLMGAMPDPPCKSFQLYFCVSYMLDTCMKSMQSLFEMKFKGVQFMTLHPWTFNFTGSKQDSRLVLHLEKKEAKQFGWAIGLQSPDAISASDIDFWNIRRPELETRQAFGMYPPCFVLRISGASALRSSVLDVSFSGGNSVIKVQVPLETEIQLPQTLRWDRALEPWNPDGGQMQFLSELVPLTAPANSSDYPSEKDLHNITKEVMAKLRDNYALLKAYLNIPDDVMAEIEHKSGLRSKVFSMLKWWSVHNEDPTKVNLVKCLVEADQALGNVRKILELDTESTSSPPTKKAALCR